MATLYERRAARRWRKRQARAAKAWAAKAEARRAAKDREARTVRAGARRRRAVPWADRAAIAGLYELARALTRITRKAHAVDHVIPLRGALVSGLHVPDNLQVLERAENSRKRNAWAPAGWVRYDGAIWINAAWRLQGPASESLQMDDGAGERRREFP